MENKNISQTILQEAKRSLKLWIKSFTNCSADGPAGILVMTKDLMTENANINLRYSSSAIKNSRVKESFKSLTLGPFSDSLNAASSSILAKAL